MIDGRPRAVVAFAVVASVLLLTAAPGSVAATSHNLSTASAHTTGSDFSAGTLTNMTVVGSGESASVTLESQTIDGFEDDDLDEYDGHTGSYTTQSSVVHDGGFAAEGTAGGDATVIHSTSGLADYPEQGDTFSAWMRSEAFEGGGDHVATLFGVQDSDNYYRAIITGNEYLLQVRDGGSLSTIDSVSASPSAGSWYRVEVDWQADGTIVATFYDDAGTEVANLSGTDSTFTSGGIGFDTHGLATSGNNTGYYDTVEFSGSQADLTPATYVSANHSATDTTQGWTDVSVLTNATATVTWEGHDGSSWTQLNQTTITSAANHTYTWSEFGGDTVRVNVTVENDTANGAPAFELDSEGVQFQARDPEAANLDPDGTTISGQTSIELSVDVSDPDFATAQGDSVEIEWTFDGSVVDTQTVTGNGTYSTTVSGLEDDEYTWNVSLADDYGGTTESADATVTLRNNAPELSNPQPPDGTTISDYDANLSVDLEDADFGSPGDNVTVVFHDLSDGSEIHNVTVSANQTIETTWSNLDLGANEWNVTAADQFSNSDSLGPFTVNTPHELEIRDEETLELLDNTTSNITVQFFPGDDSEIVTRETDDGNVSLQGLPSGVELIVSADVDGYHNRRIVIRDIAVQQTIYLLNESSASVDVTFELDDLTGNFPVETTQLIIEAPIEVNGSTRWRVLAADEFGVGGFTSTLQQDGRFRLRVRNADGDERVLGSYVASQSEVRTLEVGVVEWDVGGRQDAGRLEWQAEYLNDSAGDQYVRVSIQDDSGNLTDVDLRIYEQGNASNELHNATHAGPYGNLTVTEGPLTADQRNTTWAVSFNGTRDGESVSGQTVASTGEYPISTSLSVRALEVFTVTLIVFVAGFFPARMAAVGAIVTALVGLLLWSIGWLDLPIYWLLAALAVGTLARAVKTGGFQS